MKYSKQHSLTAEANNIIEDHPCQLLHTGCKLAKQKITEQMQRNKLINWQKADRKTTQFSTSKHRFSVTVTNNIPQR